MIFLSAELWEELDRWRRGSNGDGILGAELGRLVHFPLGIDDELDNAIDLGDEVQDAELDGIEQRLANPRRVSFRGLIRQAFRSVVPRNRFRRVVRGVHWRLSSLLNNDSQTTLEDDIDEVIRDNGTWEVDLELTE